ncbi:MULTISPECIES: competence type IV pilus assembly protein ComGB [unclassified Sporosarcina]|uniref:competence type IV pilus assembly protein ComGB n=1 Tax=unclassified Sporosarcina TaxID=2647733 RepID=UPI00204067EE|nr:MULTISPECIES: competence type IV pilus assembly protein ComGB [unclassified Sporosarcina]GKV64601.1 competence protein ComGB [Sporosarcina sp. NCCP-2331]GLB54526.1 competence protein ComGB [Sporosarcina sp. NCCP-2378]
MQQIKFARKQKLEKPAEFLQRLSILLQEGYTFHEGLILILPYHTKDYEEKLIQVENELKMGYGVSYILKSLGFSNSMMLPIVIAEVDGNLIRALHEVSARVSRSHEKKQQLKKLMAYPAVLFTFLLLLLVAFRQFFLPNFEALTILRSNEQSGIVQYLPKLVSSIPDLLLIVLIISTVAIITLNLWMKKMTAAEKLKRLLKVPVAGLFYSEMKTKDLASELGSLLQSGLSLQSALNVLHEQEEDLILAEITRQLSTHVIYGEPLHEAIRLTDGLSGRLADFAKHGADSGYLPKELLIYSEHTNDLLEERLNRWLAILQPALFGILAVCILLAYLAILLPVYRMIDTI